MNYFSIKQLPEDDRPREKLLNNGPQSLSNSELLAILISSGYKNLSALDLAKQILQHNNNSFDELAKKSVDELKNIKGIGNAKAITIVAALEIGRRRTSPSSNNIQIKLPIDVYNLIAPKLKDLIYEEFWVLYFNSQLNLIKQIKIAQGGLTGTTVDSHLIFRNAFINNAKSIILCHNHPDGSHKPSPQDIELTNKIKQACDILNIRLNDHIIICKDKYYSFSENNLL